MSNNTNCVQRADTSAIDSKTAVSELSNQLDLKNSALSVLFCSPGRDLKQLQEGLTEKAEGAPVIGCTSAGEIGSNGYKQGIISGMSLSKEEFKVSVESIYQLRDFSMDHATNLVDSLKSNLSSQGITCMEGKCFALLLVDGLSIAEEPLTFKLQKALGDIPLIGGSAGDDLNFGNTFVLSDGEFNEDKAVVALVHTDRVWEVFKEQHFHPSETKMVVTEAIPEKRIVVELNGEPAAEEMARMVGVDGPEGLTQEVLAKNPLMLKLGGNWFIRSVQQVNEDHSLTIYCAIEEGLVLALGIGEHLVEDLKSRFKDIRNRLGDIQVTIACDCIQRRLELESLGLIEVASEVLKENQAIGFSTYGEQFGAVHVNQTLTGVVIA